LKLDPALTVALIACAVLWVEHGHHINIEQPAQSRLASSAPPAACPDNDNVPYSVGCLTYLKGATEIGMRWRIKADEQPLPTFAKPLKGTEFASLASACPTSDTRPYDARCIAYLQGDRTVTH
jgi:hypothetical protein